MLDARVRLEKEKLIREELQKAWEDPFVIAYFKGRVKKEEQQRKLSKLENEKKLLEAEYSSLLSTTVEALVPEISLDSLELISKHTKQFESTKKRTPLFQIEDMFDQQWNTKLSKLNSSLTKQSTQALSQKIETGVEKLQTKFEEKFQGQVEKYIESKIRGSIGQKTKELNSLIKEPIDHILQKAETVDKGEDAVITGMYQISNFLSKGKFDISFWQKINIFSSQFKNYLVDHQKYGHHTGSLKNLCLQIQNALEKGKPGKVESLIQNYFENEQKKMQNAIQEMEKAIEIAKNKDGEKFVEELLTNAEKELEKHNKTYRTTKTIVKTTEKVTNSSGRVQALLQSVYPFTAATSPVKTEKTSETSHTKTVKPRK